MKNTMQDLNNHLFAALERLGDEEIKGDELKEEIDRTKAITDVAQQVIANAANVIKAQALKAEYSGNTVNLPSYLEG
jgi:hypothetical protein